MSRTEEVEVLRFFETGPLDRVEPVFNIVCEKMRERLRERGGLLEEPGQRRGRRRHRTSDAAPPNPPEPEL
jgi:hypothetical protein